MIKVWALFALAYGLLKGVREILKKKAIVKTDKMQVLYFYTVLSFVFVLPFAPQCLNVEPILLIPVAGKSLVLFFAWMFGFSAVEKLPISTYGVLDLSRVLFSTLLSFVLLGESATWNRILGLILVIGGLLLLQRTRTKRNYASEHEKNERIPLKYTILAIASSLLNSVSAILDKKALSTSLTDIQMLFWYLAFLVPMYTAYLLITRKGIKVSTLKIPYVWILSAVFVVAEWCVFRANTYKDSLVSVMTLMKQSACIVTIVAGKLVFKEKNILRKLICAGIVIAGIMISVIN